MFFPLITPHEQSRRLVRRKGGGGGGGKGGSSGRGGSGGKGSGGSSGGKGSSGSSKTSYGINSGGKTVSAKSYGLGGGTPAMIPAGQLFAGRMAGGGTRSQVFGTRMYGSGYPGIAGAGVAGRGFPFYFWPLVWGTAAGIGTAAYLHDDEYGLPDNSSRPGGTIAAASFQSANPINNSTFRIISDNSTVDALIFDISSNCSSYLNAGSSSTSPSEFNGYPTPEQVIQYYRSSSVALTLDGYNNSAVYANEGATDSPIPSNTDTALLNCLNQTIGLAAPLSSDAINSRLSVPHIGLLGLFYVLWNVLSLMP